ncbi:MAG: hypothetical protein LBL81_02180 [Tannerella sp.]|jgi:hypothetical protein|nr:hypothetical protein [Tannerella sp.]
MKAKKFVTRSLLILAALVAVAATVAYFVLRAQRPWLAFFLACCGGVLVFNFLLILYFVHKNFK